MIVIYHSVNSRAKTATGWSVEVKYWSTLTVRGKRCSERGGGVRVVLPLPVSWPMKHGVICRKHLSPLSLPPTIMDTSHVCFKERPDTVTLYLLIWIQGGGTLSLYRLEVSWIAPRWVLCWTWKVFSVPFDFFFQSKLRVWIAPLLLVETLLSVIMITFFVFF